MEVGCEKVEKNWCGGRSWNIWLTRVKSEKTYLTWDVAPKKDPDHCSHEQEEEGKWLQHCSLLMTMLAAFTHLLLNVKWSKFFLPYQILTLSWCLKKQIRSCWENFALSYNPFCRVIQIHNCATSRIASNTLCFLPDHRGSKLSTT